MDHRLVGPITLENVVAFLRRAVAFDQALLIHAWNGILRAQRCGKVLENPLRTAGQVRHLLLLLEMPVEEIDDVTLRPIAVQRRACLAARRLVRFGGFRCALAGGNFLQEFLGVFRMTAGVTVPAPLGMEESRHVADPFFH